MPDDTNTDETTTAPEVPPPADVEALVRRLNVRDVRIVKTAGEAPPGAVRPDLTVETALDPPRMRITQGDVSLWFEHHVRLTTTAGEVVATIETGLTVDYDLAGDEPPSEAVVGCFAETNGVFMAWPYIRQAVQDVSVRLGLAPVVLGILRRDKSPGSQDGAPEPVVAAHPYETVTTAGY